MFKITQILVFLSITILFIKPCLSDTPQPVSIPGYNPTATSAKPAANTSANPAERFPKPKKPVPATNEELQDLLKSVDLSGWANFSGYLWTCTPSYYSIPTYDAKNELKAAFDKFKEKKKMLTLKKAKEITEKIGSPVNHKIVGLYGNSCHITISVSNIEKPYTLDCYMLIINARYLSQLAYAVSKNTNTEELLPKDTADAINSLLKQWCQKQ